VYPVNIDVCEGSVNDGMIVFACHVNAPRLASAMMFGAPVCRSASGRRPSIEMIVTRPGVNTGAVAAANVALAAVVVASGDDGASGVRPPQAATRRAAVTMDSIALRILGITCVDAPMARTCPGAIVRVACILFCVVAVSGEHCRSTWDYAGEILRVTFTCLLTAASHICATRSSCGDGLGTPTKTVIGMFPRSAIEGEETGLARYSKESRRLT
jgi:hypothetical protein